MNTEQSLDQKIVDLLTNNTNKTVWEWKEEFKRLISSEVERSVKEVTRFEVIDRSGRAYTKWNTNVELSFQDDGKTLKVFVDLDSQVPQESEEK